MLLPEGKHPDGNGAYLIVAAAQKRAVRSPHRHHVPFGRIACKLGYGTGKHPRVKTQQGLFPTLL